MEVEVEAEMEMDTVMDRVMDRVIAAGRRRRRVSRPVPQSVRQRCASWPGQAA
jgi:hypothetical protein